MFKFIYLFFILFFVIINTSFVYINILLLFILLFYFIYKNKNNKTYFLFLFYPFAILTRISNPDNLILILFPEISILIIFIYSLIQGLNFTRHSIFVIIWFLIYFLLCSLTISKYNDIFILFRFILIPLLFFLVFDFECKKNILLPLKSISAFIYSSAIVCFIALLNFFGYVKLNSNNLIYQPFIISELDTIPQRNVILTDELLPRINFLIAANTGSIAAIFITFSIIVFYLCKNVYLRLVIFLIFFFASLISSSFSIILPIIYFLFLRLYKFNVLALIFIIFIYSIFLISSNLNFSFTEISTLEYTSKIIESWVSSFNYSFFEIFTGKGYVIMNNLINENKKNLIIDIGIIRLFQDAGIFIFLTFICYILYLIKKGINNINANKINIIYPLILLTLISLIHNNWVLFPPIYLVAFASISAIRNNDKITINDKS